METCRYCGRGGGEHSEKCPVLQTNTPAAESELKTSPSFDILRESPEGKAYVSEKTQRDFAKRVLTESHENGHVENLTRSLLERNKKLGSGNKSDFYTDDDLRLGVKHLARPEKSHAHEKDFEQEMALQSLAMVIVEKWADEDLRTRQDKEKDPAKRQAIARHKMAKVPEVVAHVSDEKKMIGGKPSEYLVMETVRGKTLAHLMYLNLFERLMKRHPDRVNDTDRKEYKEWSEDNLQEYLFTRFDELIGKSPTERATLIYNTLHGSGIVSKDIFRQVGLTVRALNNAGFFHRDLHERNIMISDDGSQAYIIDFGGSLYDESYKSGPQHRPDTSAVYSAIDVALPKDTDAPARLDWLSSDPSGSLKPGAPRLRI